MTLNDDAAKAIAALCLVLYLLFNLAMVCGALSQ